MAREQWLFGICCALVGAVLSRWIPEGAKMLLGFLRRRRDRKLAAAIRKSVTEDSAIPMDEKEGEILRRMREERAKRDPFGDHLDTGRNDDNNDSFPCGGY